MEHLIPSAGEICALRLHRTPCFSDVARQAQSIEED